MTESVQKNLDQKPKFCQYIYYYNSERIKRLLNWQSPT